MSKNELLVTPEEAVNLSYYYGAVSALNVISDINEAVIKKLDLTDESDRDLYNHLLLLSIWQGGIIQGIREERRKKKKPSVSVPRLNIKTMSDFKWQYLALIDRLSSPEKYKEVDNDVNETIDRLKAWLCENINSAAEVLTPEELDTLNCVLSV